MAGETPDSLILIEPPPYTDISRIAPHFRQQLLEYFRDLDKYSTFHSLLGPTAGYLPSSTFGQPTSRYLLRYGITWSSIALLLHTQHANYLDRIQEWMMNLQQRMELSAPLIRDRIIIIGSHGVNAATGIRSFLCEDMDDIRAVQVYRLLMPPDFPQIHIILDTGNHNCFELEDVVRGINCAVRYRFM